MSTRLARFAAGTIAAAGIAAVARRARALSSGGSVAAVIVGSAVVGGLGLRAGAAIVAFFASSTFLGRLPRFDSIQEQQRGNERDAVQVLANGGIPALLALGSALTPPGTRYPLTSGFSGAVATAAADTWATEIGSRWGGLPRSIATLRPVPRGASGGVTGAGLLASLAGAASIAVITDAAPKRRPTSRHIAAITLAGSAGALADSILGATVQHVRWCDTCHIETERMIHRCGTPATHLRGLAWCDNDVVNALATAVGAVTAATLTGIDRR